MIILNNTEYTTHTPDNTTLLTVVDIVSADNMTSYFFLKPAMILSTAYRVSFHLSWTLNIFISKIMIIFRIIIFSKRNSCTFAVIDVLRYHNDDIARLADRIVRIEDGKIVE